MTDLYNTVDRDLTVEPAKLGANINSLVTTIVTDTGDGAKLPASNGVLKIVQFNDQTGTYKTAQASGVLKWERIELTTRSTDTLTVVRGFGTGSTAQSFAGGSYILNTIDSVISERQNEFIRAGNNPYKQEVNR